jgi:RNA polymerase sigma factor (TIGR02999 family)
MPVPVNECGNGWRIASWVASRYRIAQKLTGVVRPFYSHPGQPALATRMPHDQPGEVSQLLGHWAKGDPKALTELLPLVYQELQRVAHHHLRQERPDHTLQSTALVHEAYLRLLGNEPLDLQGRTHFIAIASRLIRQILVDYARERNAAKRDGGCRIPVEFLDALPVTDDADLLALDEALLDLSRIDARQAQIVEMKFFGGLASPEIATLLGISRATVDRDWATARAWLHRQMSRAGSK